MQPNTDTLRVAGVDEAGRGPLAGPVVAAAVILGEDHVSLSGLTDSKKLSEAQRRRLEPLIKASASAWSIGEASAEEIDQINILQATLLAMRRAVAGLAISPTEVLVDGNQDPGLAVPTTTIVKGDLSEPCISAASVLAKQARDRMMVALHQQHPEYGFAQHKGYPTAQHRQALQNFGAIAAHRRSFGPVRQCL